MTHLMNCVCRIRFTRTRSNLVK